MNEFKNECREEDKTKWDGIILRYIYSRKDIEKKKKKERIFIFPKIIFYVKILRENLLFNDTIFLSDRSFSV